MSLGDANFPDLHEDDSIRPPATRENPGQVYPKVNPSLTQMGLSGSGKDEEHSPSRYHSNPHHYQASLKRLDDALDDVITAIEQEATNLNPGGQTGDESRLLLKFKGWRRELSTVRSGVGDRIGHRLDMGDGIPAERGGIFAD